MTCPCHKSKSSRHDMCPKCKKDQGSSHVPVLHVQTGEPRDLSVPGVAEVAAQLQDCPVHPIELDVNQEALENVCPHEHASRPPIKKTTPGHLKTRNARNCKDCGLTSFLVSACKMLHDCIYDSGIMMEQCQLSLPRQAVIDEHRQLPMLTEQNGPTDSPTLPRPFYA